ncbi:hypothetical protein BS50DRAFT_306383 [Corynespora cassiicola Philippines]|uniref:Uncharacterized protein n=1 Tax=Corynespora cassiicola Philippines TaxID=1448308 RepID=A0A2T2NXI6_CORCC|nr:hypothetical protein BS50DRAFT_306383 [Corynespora cassiicola Philippines]
MASQSVWGTVESQLLMQRLSLVGANLLFLWALSPLGGQASLRLMTRDGRETLSPIKLRYSTTGPGATMWGLATTTWEHGNLANAAALYTAALLAPLPVKNGPRDLWGNVKMPTLEALNLTAADSNGWKPVPTNISTPEFYSSLVGLPLSGLPLSGVSNFSMESTYLSVDCRSFIQTPYKYINGSMDWTALEGLAPGRVWSNKTRKNPFGSSEKPATFFIDTDRESHWAPGEEYEAILGRLDGFIGHYNQSRLNESEAKRNREISYTSKYATSAGGSEFGLNLARCSLSQYHVEAMIQCDGELCAAKKIRKSLSDTRPTTPTGFEHAIIMDSFAENFPTAITFGAGSSPTELFLTNTSAIPHRQRVGLLPQNVAYTDLSLVPSDLFSRRLGLVFNTYYQLSMQPSGYLGGGLKNLSAYGPDTLPVTDINAYLPANLSATEHSFVDWWTTFEQQMETINSPYIGATTYGNVTTTEEIFVCNFAWLALLFTSSGVVLIIGAVALILKHRTLGPEMFGFVTSMTYQNPYMKIPGGGTTLDAMERARLLRDVEVCIGDVHGEEDVGHIALATGVTLRKLERERLYA